MKNIFLTTALFIIGLNGFGQVAIGDGNPTPHPNSILDLRNISGDGLVLPILTGALPSAPAGLIVFDSIEDVIWVTTSSTGAKNALSAWSYDPGTGVRDTYFTKTGNVGIGISNPSTKFTVASGTEASGTTGGNGYVLIGDFATTHIVMDDYQIIAKTDGNTSGILSLQTDGGTVNVGRDASANLTASGNVNSDAKIQENSMDLVPAGTIVMWYGSVSGNNPVIGGVANTNWHICNGAGSTPNLSDKFVVGVGPNAPYNVPGGSLSSNHTHDVNPGPYTSVATEGTHAHSGTTSGPSGVYDPAVSLTTQNVASSTHTHNFTTDATQGAHTHTIDVPNTTSTGASFSDNRPPYLALYYIMKL